MSWTSENYPKVREGLGMGGMGVFDRMANEGKRLREAAGDEDLHQLLIRWRHACKLAGVEHVPAHQLRLDYITAAVEARRG